MEISKTIVRIYRWLLLISVVRCKNAKFRRDGFTPEDNFLKVAKYPSFVDKTLLISQVFEGPQYIAITAPRRFGKSTNLDMLKTFLSFPVNHRGQRDNKAVQQTREVFKRLEIYKQEKSLFKEHFAQHPVIFISFFCGKSIKSDGSAIDAMRKIIHKQFMARKYLCSSKKLTQDERKLCKKWINPNKINGFYFEDIVKGLHKLSKFLCKHYGKKTIILVDNYESIISRAVFNVHHKIDLIFIVCLNNCMLIRATDVNSTYVERVVLTGISYIATVGLIGLNNIQHYGFLGDHRYGDYYGFLEPEVNKLFIKFNVSTEKAIDARNWYDGYVCRNGRHIYSPFSILTFLSIGKVGYNWVMSGQVKGLEDVSKYFPIEKRIRRMLGDECIEIKFFSNITIMRVYNLSTLLDGKTNKTDVKNVVDLFFSYLLERGYLCYGGKKNNLLRIPNNEIEGEFNSKLLSHYITRFKLDRDLLKECANFFKNVIPLANQTSQAIEGEMQAFFSALKKLFYKFTAANGKGVSSGADLERVMFAVISGAIDFVRKIQLVNKIKLKNGKTKKSRIDLYLHKGPFATIIELKYVKNMDPNSTAALDQILERRYYNVFGQRKFMRQKIKYFLLVGLSVNSKSNVSVSCLLNTVNITQAVTVTG